MRKMKIFVSIVAILCLIFSLSACAGGKSDEPEGQLDAVDVQEGEGEGDVIPDVIPDPGVDDGEGDSGGATHSGNEGEVSPGTHDGYYHEVDGVGFYTEHDINQWLTPDPQVPDLYDFDIGQMLYDLWCEDGGGILENNVGFSYVNGSSSAKGVWFEVPDAENTNSFHMVTIFYSVDGVEYTTAVRIYNYPSGTHPEIYYEVLDGYYHSIHRDMAPLILLAIERMEANPQNGVLDDLPLGDNFYCN